MIMSLWPVQDEAALRWMKEAYEARFGRGVSTVEATRAAALETMAWAKSSRRTSHPFYWGAFLAAGDWR